MEALATAVKEVYFQDIILPMMAVQKLTNYAY